jgi:hypothetical protein
LQHFGTWNDAVRAAGIDPNRIRPYSKSRRPSRPKLLEMIRQRKRQGQSLRWCDVRYEDYAFAMATKNRFRSWRAALLAAGVVSEDGG